MYVHIYIWVYIYVYIWAYVCIWVYTSICTNKCFPLEIKTQCHSILQVSFVYLFLEIPLRSCESIEWPGSPEEPPISASLARGVELYPTTIATFAHAWGLNRDPHACTASISLTERASCSFSFNNISFKWNLVRAVWSLHQALSAWPLIPQGITSLVCTFTLEFLEC